MDARMERKTGKIKESTEQCSSDRRNVALTDGLRQRTETERGSGQRPRGLRQRTETERDGEIVNH